MESSTAHGTVQATGSEGHERSVYLVCRPDIRSYVEICAWDEQDAAKLAFGNCKAGVAVIQMDTGSVRHTHAHGRKCEPLYTNHPSSGYYTSRRAWNRSFTAGYQPVRL